nr:MAG TPA: hypothetical protein [Caudoviricetes sp.]
MRALDLWRVERPFSILNGTMTKLLTQRLRSGRISLPRESDGDGIGVPSHTAQDEAADRWKRLFSS